MVRFLKKYQLELVCMLPITLFILGFTLIPILQTIILSFQSPTTKEFTLSVYQDLFKRNSFAKSIGNTLWITCLGLMIQIGIGFMVAFILKKKFVGQGLVRAVVLLPMGVPTIVAGVSMLYIFMTSGYLNEFFYVLHLRSTPINWTATRFLSLFQVAFADSWKVMPTVVLFFLSGLEGIPEDIYEAADIDGTSGLQKLFFITLPLLKNTITMIVMLRAVDLLRIFELPMVLLGKAVPFVGTFAFEEFSYGNTNASAAASTVLLVIIIIFVAVYMAIFNREGGGINAGKKNS